jgi:monofunctional biosynthetic peptidoglycan transglycosylase
VLTSAAVSAARPIRRALLALLAAALLGVGGLAALWTALPDPTPLARTDPGTTALIEQRRAEAAAKRRPYRVRRTWVPLERVPPHAIAALLLSEDAGFYGHGGVDWAAMRAAAEHDLKVGRFARGASTLTQQLAKNLWLGTRKSLGRKAREAVLAWKLERALSKRRILALYLNVVELGEGVFGIEAGARARFGVGAADLSPAQAVVLVSMLPAPLRVDLARPSTWLKRRSRRLLDTLHATGRLDDAAHRRAAAELERILAGPRPSDDGEEPPDEVPPEAPTPSVDPAQNGGAGTAGQAEGAPSEQPPGSSQE